MTDFEKLFEENRSFIFKYLFRLCKNTALAEELTQETFYRAYMNIASLKKEDKTSMWLCSIAKNAYFAYYNENKKLQPLECNENIQSSFDTESSFEDKELSKRAFSVLHTLEEPYKEVFMLSVFGGLSLKDISAMFGKSESWARVTYYRAKQKIMEGLEK